MRKFPVLFHPLQMARLFSLNNPKANAREQSIANTMATVGSLQHRDSHNRQPGPWKTLSTLKVMLAPGNDAERAGRYLTDCQRCRHRAVFPFMKCQAWSLGPGDIL
jgi:hypothetical protein